MKSEGKMRVAIPTMWPGGIDAQRSGHFGRCDCFTMVEFEAGKSVLLEVIPNVPHEQGSCLTPVQLLQGHNASAIVVGGIGMRPLMGFRQAGIEVLSGPGTHVKHVVTALEEGRVEAIGDQNVCGGGH